MAAAAAEAAGLEELDLDQNLLELGLDSLRAAEFASQARTHGLAPSPAGIPDIHGMLASHAELLTFAQLLLLCSWGPLLCGRPCRKCAAWGGLKEGGLGSGGRCSKHAIASPITFVGVCNQASGPELP